MTDTNSGLSAEPPAVLMPSAASVAELGKLRRRELETISARLGRICARKMRWDRFFAVSGSVFLGGGVGGGLGLIPFYAQEPNPKGAWQAIYLLSIASAFLLAVMCGLGWVAVKREREDSVEAIKEDLDTLLGAYN